MRVLVIGAGASGLVTAKTLRERGHDVNIVTDSSVVGGTFENKSYKDARMVSSKYLTCFSDCRRPEAQVHMSLADYVTYLEEYTAQFQLGGLMRKATRVLNVRRLPATSSYAVALQSEGESSPHEEEWDAVAVCSGVHNIPRIPLFPGQETFRGKLFHSSCYKDPEVFRGQRVLVIGTGETGFDIGYAAATHGAKSVTLSTRHGFVSVPSHFGEHLPPLDCIIMNWGTHYWESQWAARVGLHWWITTKFTRLGFLLMTGTTYGFNQWAGKRYNMTWDEGRKHIVNKSSKCMPLLTRKLKRQAPWWQRMLWSWWDGPDSLGEDIDLVEGSVRRLEGDAVHYDTAAGPRSVEADVVVLATGYRQRFPFLFPGPDEKAGPPSPEAEALHGDDPLPEEHFIVNPAEPRLAFIGFVRPNVGAIPPMAELQAMWWCEKLEDKLVCKAPTYYKLKESRLPYGVDYGYYMFALAREMRAVPSLLYWLFRRPSIAVTCGFGQAHVPIFRLQGPFASKAAEETCANELFAPIMQRPFFMNLIFFVEALFFAGVNGLMAFLENPAGRLATLTMGLGYVALTQHGRDRLSALRQRF